MIDVEREFVTLSAAIGDAGERQLLTRTVGTKGISVGLDVLPAGTVFMVR